jgi:ATP-dependent DNA helicase RecG
MLVRKHPASTPQVPPQVQALLKAAQIPLSRTELQEIIQLKDREHFRKAYLKPLLSAGWIAMTIPGKPLSASQRYLTTPKGLEQLQRSGS